MSSRLWSDRVRDILEAIAEIHEFVEGMSQSDFCMDKKTIKAVELNLIVIGEAASHIPKEIQEFHPAVPWKIMKAMRNRLVHVYFAVDAKIIWETIRGDLKALIAPLQEMVLKDTTIGNGL